MLSIIFGAGGAITANVGYQTGAKIVKNIPKNLSYDSI